MTPFGHLSASYISGRSIKLISIPAVISGGILPDIDFLFVFFPFFNDLHRIVTHNLLFLILVSLAGFILSGRKIHIPVSLLLGGAIHLLIDSVMDNNPTNGIGVALLWPFWNDVYSPFNVLRVLEHSSGWHDPAGMIKALLPAIMYESPFYFISAFLYFRNRRSSSENCC